MSPDRRDARGGFGGVTEVTGFTAGALWLRCSTAIGRTEPESVTTVTAPGCTLVLGAGEVTEGSVDLSGSPPRQMSVPVEVAAYAVARTDPNDNRAVPPRSNSG